MVGGGSGDRCARTSDPGGSHAAEAILEFAQSENISMIVMASHGQSWPARGETLAARKHVGEDAPFLARAGTGRPRSQLSRPLLEVIRDLQLDGDAPTSTS